MNDFDRWTSEIREDSFSRLDRLVVRLGGLLSPRWLDQSERKRLLTVRWRGIAEVQKRRWARARTAASIDQILSSLLLSFPRCLRPLYAFRWNPSHGHGNGNASSLPRKSSGNWGLTSVPTWPPGEHEEKKTVLHPLMTLLPFPGLSSLPSPRTGPNAKRRSHHVVSSMSRASSVAVEFWSRHHLCANVCYVSSILVPRFGHGVPRSRCSWSSVAKCEQPQWRDTRRDDDRLRFLASDRVTFVQLFGELFDRLASLQAIGRKGVFSPVEGKPKPPDGIDASGLTCFRKHGDEGDRHGEARAARNSARITTLSLKCIETTTSLH